MQRPGGRGGPQNLFSSQILFFCELKPHAKFQNPTITSSGRKVMAAERRKKEKQAQMCAEGCEGAFLYTFFPMIFLLIVFPLTKNRGRLPFLKK